jgi:hypothetical protein
MSSNNLTLNRVFGLPSLYGRYKRVCSECDFHHYRTGDKKEQTTPRECVEDAYVALTVSGAKCNDESLINGIYTYYNWTDPAVVKQAGALAISVYIVDHCPPIVLCPCCACNIYCVTTAGDMPLDQSILPPL